MCGCFGNVWVFWSMCGCFGKYVYCTLNEVFLTLTEVFPCFFLSCKANKCQGKTRKDGARPALFQISCYLCCSVVIYVLFTVCV